MARGHAVGLVRTPRLTTPHYPRRARVTASGLAGEAFPGVRHLHLQVTRGELVAIVGVVGSGKTSLLQGMMGLMVRDGGFVGIRGTVSYACQSAWIFNDTVRNNVLFGAAYSAVPYESAVRACALEPDLQLVRTV